MKNKRVLLVGCGAVAAIACALVVASPSASLLRNTKAATDKTLNITAGAGNSFSGTSLLEYDTDIKAASKYHEMTISGATSPVKGSCFKWTYDSILSSTVPFGNMTIGATTDDFILKDPFVPYGSISQGSTQYIYKSYLCYVIGLQNIQTITTVFNTTATSGLEAYEYDGNDDSYQVTFYDEDFSINETDSIHSTVPIEPSGVGTKWVWALVVIYHSIWNDTELSSETLAGLSSSITSISATWSC
jgi:hypothetical protein